MNTNNTKENKPRVHAELIKAWADGAKIQLKTESGEWVDVAANWPCWSVNYEYRIKPKEEKAWLRHGIQYFFVTSTCTISHVEYSGSNADIARLNRANCFRTKEEAEAAIPRVKAALKGATDVSANVGSNVGSPEIDGKPLMAGEKALIKALRGVKLEHVCNEGESLLVYSHDNCPTFHVSHIAFHVPGGIEKRKAIFDALKQIQAEQAVSRES